MKEIKLRSIATAVTLQKAVVVHFTKLSPFWPLFDLRFSWSSGVAVRRLGKSLLVPDVISINQIDTRQSLFLLLFTHTASFIQNKKMPTSHPNSLKSLVHKE